MLQFDPTYNYGDIDLTIDENLVRWKFGELIKTLITMRSVAERQVEIIGAGIATDEMAEDFDTYFTLSYKQLRDFGLLDEEVISKLNELDEFLDCRSGDKAPEFWDDLLLATNKDWAIVRVKANEILTLIRMNDLDIEFDRTEKYVTTDKGKQLTMQTTNSRLIRKNG